VNAFIIVEANMNDFTQTTKNVFYFNLSISLFLTLFIAFILITLIKNFHKKLEELASIDSLTSLSNRRSFSQKLENIMKLSIRNKQELSLLFIDIDDFKNINDTLGHKSGDLVLQQLAHILESNIRQTDLCARLGGEEFVVAFIASSAENAFIIADALREKVSQDHTLLSLLSHPLTISAGLTEMKEDDTMDTLVSRADSAMYKAKESGKNRVYLL
jgi:diguanylate cyclase (GGDEF)-like protein